MRLSSNLSVALRLLLLSFLFLNAVDAQDESGGDGGGEKACDKDFDICFVIDGSGSIEQAGKGNFNRIKSFIKEVYRGFNVGFASTHIGAIIFSSSRYVKKVFDLDAHYDYNGLDKAIDNMVYPSGGTYTGKALRLARNQCFQPSKDRKDKSNVVIVITDGRANDDIEGPANELRQSKSAAIFAIGVGQTYDRSELEKMAGTPRNVYTADFDDLNAVINEIKQSACRADQPPPPPQKIGLPGDPGPKGEKGELGVVGVKGQPGNRGPPGTGGSDGPQGDQGLAGPPGLPGPPGPFVTLPPGGPDEGGPDPIGIIGEIRPQDSKGPMGLIRQIRGPPGEAGLPGKAGAPGNRGPEGARGEAGEMGLAGPNGDPGEDGPAGAPGESGRDGNDGLTGATGEPGEPGDVGEPGPTGIRGMQGLQGIKGDRGSQGEPGDPGDQGIAGETGTRGQDGRAGIDGLQRHMDK